MCLEEGCLESSFDIWTLYYSLFTHQMISNIIILYSLIFLLFL
nr:MAG TPA: hypothetical protein [Bacteriophage sp.]